MRKRKFNRERGGHKITHAVKTRPIPKQTGGFYNRDWKGGVVVWIITI